MFSISLWNGNLGRRWKNRFSKLLFWVLLWQCEWMPCELLMCFIVPGPGWDPCCTSHETPKFRRDQPKCTTEIPAILCHSLMTFCSRSLELGFLNIFLLCHTFHPLFCTFHCANVGGWQISHIDLLSTSVNQPKLCQVFYILKMFWGWLECQSRGPKTKTPNEKVLQVNRMAFKILLAWCLQIDLNHSFCAFPSVMFWVKQRDPELFSIKLQKHQFQTNVFFVLLSRWLVQLDLLQCLCGCNKRYQVSSRIWTYQQFLVWLEKMLDTIFDSFRTKTNRSRTGSSCGDNSLGQFKALDCNSQPVWLAGWVEHASLETLVSKKSRWTKRFTWKLRTSVLLFLETSFKLEFNTDHSQHSSFLSIQVSICTFHPGDTMVDLIQKHRCVKFLQFLCHAFLPLLFTPRYCVLGLKIKSFSNVSSLHAWITVCVG